MLAILLTVALFLGFTPVAQADMILSFQEPLSPIDMPISPEPFPPVATPIILPIEVPITHPILPPRREATLLEMVNTLLGPQLTKPLTQKQLLASRVDYETFAPGFYSITGYGKQSAYVQSAYAYSPDSKFADLHLLTATKDTKGILLPEPVKFAPPGDWGLKGVTKGGTFYSQLSRNPDNTGHWQLFCLEKIGLGHIGFAAYEDLWKGKDKDYNDLVLKIEPQPAAIPLPATLLLLGSGIIALAFRQQRRR